MALYSEYVHVYDIVSIFVCFSGVCPVLCSGRGQYVHGFCECIGGWKGPECNVPWDQCLVADCNGQGVCMEGECICYRGYTGVSCEQGNKQHLEI